MAAVPPVIELVKTILGDVVTCIGEEDNDEDGDGNGPFNVDGLFEGSLYQN